MQQLQIIERREVLGKDFKIYGNFENPLFVAADVAEWIGHRNVTEMLRSVDDDEKLTSTILRAGQRRQTNMLTEYGLYEVLMQSRKPIAKEFKKQVKEILRSIRKTGSYSLEQKQEQPYEYFDKMFNGVPVVSALDIAHFTGLSQTTVGWYVRKSDLICGIDYFIAEGRALAEMKKRYPKLSVMISRMLLVTKSGFNKLMKENNIHVEPLPCFENTKCSEPVNDMHRLIDTVLVELNQLHDTVKKLDRYNTTAEQNLYRDKIKKLERSVSQKLVVISQVDMQNITGNFGVAAIDKKEILESKRYSFLDEPLAVFYSEKGNTTAAMRNN